MSEYAILLTWDDEGKRPIAAINPQTGHKNQDMGLGI
jgi:hypothetical protein